MKKNPTFRLYVVELSQAVWEVRRWQKENSKAKRSKPCFYVGSTAHEVEHRYRQHLAGELWGFGWVRRFGIRLRPDLVPNCVYGDRGVAEAAEMALAAELRRRGSGVWQR